MKAVILAAGETRTQSGYGFPPNSKPKCLFHVGKITILERTVTALRTAGIEDIRIVVGYRGKDIVEYNEERGLNLEVVHNPDWGEDAPASLFAGLKDVDDDVLLLMFDLIIDDKLIRVFLEHEEDELVWMKTVKPKTRRIYPECRDKDVSIVKIGKEKLDIFEGIDGRQILTKFGWKKVQGNEIYALLYEGLRHNNPAEVNIIRPLKDIDYYWQTEEYRQELKRKKAVRPLS